MKATNIEETVWVILAFAVSLVMSKPLNSVLLLRSAEVGGQFDSCTGKGIPGTNSGDKTEKDTEDGFQHQEKYSKRKCFEPHPI
jgi:hypothetical protein